MPAGGGDLTFWVSRDTEPAWDHLFVEVRSPGGDDWTTLPGRQREHHDGAGRLPAPRAGGTCTRSSTTTRRGTGPRRARRRARPASGTQPPATPSGWQQWRIDLDAYAARTVEISIAYVSDWSVQNLGVFIDDVVLPDGTSTSFEADLGGWAPGQPDTSGTNANNWIRTDDSGFPVGASISTPDSLLFGFGFEGISSQASRNAVMGRSLRFLLD